MMNDRRIKRGTIRRVRMHNFLTFDDCEVFPGPKLNVVIGPNGSGKSSMTHAICLACAGTPEQIGKLIGPLTFFLLLVLSVTFSFQPRPYKSIVIFREIRNTS